MSAVTQFDPADEMPSCDGARRRWFAAAISGRAIPGAPDEAALDEIRSEREAIRQCEGGGGCSMFVANAIENYFGWPTFQGVYLSADNYPIDVHAWNLLPDGGILDATADRFGEGHDIRILLPDDPDWRRYRAEWTTTYNPDLAWRHQELFGCQWTGHADLPCIMRWRKVYGDEPWWLRGADTSALEAFRERQRGYAEMARFQAPGQG